MKSFSTFLLLVLLSFPLLAQKDWTVLSSVCRKASSENLSQKSSATYAADCNSFSQKVFPGDVLSSAGCLNVPSDCVIKLLYKGESTTLESGKLYSLASLAKSTGHTSRLSFSSRFLNFISKCLEETDDEKTMVENHRKNMETIRAGIKGMGKMTPSIHTNLLTEGQMSSENLTFHWEKDDTQEFLFRLYRTKDKMDLLMKKLTTNSYETGNGEIFFEPGESYTWEVTSATDAKKRSASRTFIYNPEEAAGIMTDLIQQPDFNSLTEEEKILMYAYALEERQYYYDAASQYSAAVRTYPDNRLILRTAAAFYARMDMLDLAKSTLN